ncbi:MAG: hypothetical protein GX447_05530 [Elusimicrobia bacterium]|nr:hypothetical protein [Elusimicrobiota bacterium]
MKNIFLLFAVLSPIGLNAKDAAFLWLPPQKPDFSVLTSSMPQKAKLTVACEIEKCADLSKYVQKDKIELSAAPKNMSFVSLIYFPSSIDIDFLKTINDNPSFFALTAADLKKEAEQYYSPSGFVSPYGDLNLSQISLYKALGYSWAAAGANRQKENCLFDYGGFKIPVFEILTSTQQVFLSSCPFFAINDSFYETDYSSSTMEALFSAQDINMLTVSQAIAVSTPDALTENELSFYPWVGYKDYLNSEQLYPYIKTLSLLKNDITLFLNSAPKKEKELLSQYFEAEKLISDIRNGKDISQAEEEASEIIISAYQIMGKSAPDFAYKPFFAKKENKNYEMTVKNKEISFYALNPQLSISEFSVGETEKGLSFVIKSSTQSEIKDLGIYIDINSATGAGNVSLLNSVKNKLYVKNAWDYALIAEKDKIHLYGYSFYSLKKLKTYPLKKDGGNRLFFIPSSDMPQNFEKWKYAVINSYSGNIIDGIYKDIQDGFIYPF